MAGAPGSSMMSACGGDGGGARGGTVAARRAGGGSISIDTKRLRALLLEQRERLAGIADTQREAVATVELDQSRVGRLSRMDAMQAQALSAATGQRREVELRRIAAALARLDAGEYGDCMHCGEPIAPARLEVDPAATLCIGCAGSAERGG